jgi:hypothetical protein
MKISVPYCLNVRLVVLLGVVCEAIGLRCSYKVSSALSHYLLKEIKNRRSR